MNEANHEALTLVVKTLYPYQPRSLSMPYLSIPFSWAKRKLMKVTGLNRWDVDKWIIDLHAKTFDGNAYAFCFLDCGSLPTSRLNYVSWWGDGGSKWTSGYGYCSLQLDRRNKYMQAILAELKTSKDA